MKNKEDISNLSIENLAIINGILQNEKEHYQKSFITVKAENEKLKKQLEWFKRQIFGQKSERFIDTSSVHEDLPGFEFPEQIKEELEELKIPAHTRKKRKKEDLTVSIPEDLPREVEIIDIPEEKKICPETGESLVEIGRDVTEKLAFKPGEYFIKQTIRPKYAVKGSPLSSILQESAPDCIIEGSKFDASFMAHVVTEKFAYHMPLNRIIEKLTTRDIVISSQTMSSLVINLGNKVKPLFDLMKQETLNQGVIFTDDTSVKLITRMKTKAKQAYMWIYLGGKPNAPPYHIYEFSESRSHNFPIKHLSNFEGYLHADAFSAYEKLHNDENKNIHWVACWAHARRKFMESGNTQFIRQILRKMRYLFLFERIAWTKTSEERLSIRKQHENQIVDEIIRLLKEYVKQNKLLPQSPLAKAIGYMLSREENFKLYLKNPDLRMENNPAENGLRKLVIGRKNWLFVGSERSGKATAALLSLVQSCRAMKINPQEYLEDIFKRLLSHPARRLHELLPDKWKILRDQKPSAEN